MYLWNFSYNLLYVQLLRNEISWVSGVGVHLKKKKIKMWMNVIVHIL